MNDEPEAVATLEEPTPTVDKPPVAETALEAEMSADAEPESPSVAEAEEASVEAAAPVASSIVPPAPVPAEPAVVSNKKWYIIKVTSGREESIKAAIERRVKIEGLEPFYGQIHIPVERIVEVKKVKEKKNGETITKERRVTKERKKFPGYVMAEVEFNDQILYLFRETNGVADFVGGASAHKPPTPMEDIDVKRMMGDAPAGEAEGGSGSGRKKAKTVVKLDYDKGDKVRIREGAFANMVGEVKSIMLPKEPGEEAQVTVVVEVIGRPLDVTLESWQVDKV